MKFFLGLLIFFYSHCLYAESVYILTDIENKKYHKINDRILQEIKKYDKKYDLNMPVHLISYKDYEKVNNDDRVVFIGKKSFQFHQKVREKKPAKIVYSAMTSDILASLEKKNLSYEYIVSLEPKYTSLIKLSKQLINKKYKKKILIPASPALIKKLKRQLPSDLLDLVTFYEISNQGGLNTALLEEELFKSSVMLAVYDPVVWRGQAARTLLYLAYNYKVPVVAYSKAFLKSGASYVLHTDIDDIAQSVAETTFSKNISPVVYPKFKLAKNDNVIRALHIDSPVYYKEGM